MTTTNKLEHLWEKPTVAHWWCGKTVAGKEKISVALLLLLLLLHLGSSLPGGLELDNGNNCAC